MARFNQIINNFTLGEVSPRSYGRTDLDLYKSSCQELTNAIVHPQGGASRRPGGVFVGDTFQNIGSLGSDTRLIPFIFSRTESYLIILTANAVGSNPVEIIDAKTLQTVKVIDGGIRSAFDDLSSFEGYSADEIQSVQYAQSGDVIYFTHPNHPPWSLKRVGLNTFIQSRAWWQDFYLYGGQLANNGNTVDEVVEAWPFTSINPVTSLTLTASAVTGTITVSADLSAADYNMFYESHIGSVFAIVDSSVVGFFVVTGMNTGGGNGNYHTVDAEVLVELPAGATSGLATWVESMWSDYRGWPRAVTFFEQRLIFGGNDSFPDTIWGSQVGNIYRFTDKDSQIDSDDVLNTDPFKETLQSDKVNKIQWLSSGRQLTIGTIGNEIISSGRDPADVLGPLNPGYSEETNHGSKYIQPIKVNNSILFVQRSGQKMYEFVFDLRENNFRASDVSLLSEHISKKSIAEYAAAHDSEIVQMSYQKSNDSLIWMIDSNGGLFALTKDQLNGVNAWHWHELGGSYATENAKVLSIASTPSPAATHDNLWAIVQRTVDSSTTYTLEKFGRQYIDSDINNSSENIYDKPVYMDFSRLYIQDSDLTFRATYRSSLDADISDGTATGTATNASISNGVLDATLTGASAEKYVDYSATSNADFLQTLCVRFLYSPAYTPSQLGAATMFTISDSSGSQDNLITLSRDASTRDLELIVYDGASSLFTQTIESAWNPTRGQWYLFEINIDLTSGLSEVYIDGVKKGSNTSTATRSGTIGFLRVGGNYDGTKGAYGYIRDFQVYSAVKHTADYDPVPYYGLTEYIQSGTSIPLLDHLEGEDVVVVSDGSYDNEYTVSSGSITVSEAFSWALIGLNYQTVITPLTADAGSQTGSAHGLIKRFDRLALRFMRTIGAKFGRDKDNLDEIEFDTDSDPTPMFTGLITEDFPGTYDKDAAITVTQDLPLPFTLTSAIMRGVTYD